jgi:Tfp pilus assembly protein PilF
MTCLAEDTILAFVEGRLAPAAIEAVEAHTRNCSDCRDLLSVAVAVAAPGRPDTVAVAAAALATNDRAQEIFTRACGAGSPSIALILSNRGEYLVALGRHDEAIAAFRGALGRWEPQLGVEHPFLAHPLTGLGLAHLAAGRPADALPPLERALRLREAREPDANMVAETRFALAKALWSAGTDRARARRLAEQARDTYLRDRARASSVTEVSMWLLAHGPK